MPRDRRAQIGTGIWAEKSMRQLTRRQRDAYLLALTQGDVNRCGVLPYRLRYLAGLAIDSTVEDLAQDYADLTNTRHVVVDAADELMLLRTYVKHDGLLSQPLVVASMIRDYHRITSPTIRTAVLAEMRRLWEDPDLEPREHQGLELVLGANPADLGMRGADKLASAISGGLLGPLLGAISEGLVDPFPRKGLPKGLTEGQSEGLTGGRSTVPASAPVPAPATATVPATADHPDDPTSRLLIEHVNAYDHPPTPDVQSATRVQIQRLVANHTPAAYIRAGLAKMRAKQLSPRQIPELVAECTPTKPQSTTDQRVATGHALVEKYRAEEAQADAS